MLINSTGQSTSIINRCDSVRYMKAAHHATISHQGDTTTVLPHYYFWHSLSTILFALIRERGRSHLIHPTGNGTKLSTNSQHNTHPQPAPHTPQSISSDFLLYQYPKTIEIIPPPLNLWNEERSHVKFFVEQASLLCCLLRINQWHSTG